jgi:hypothetical protein
MELGKSHLVQRKIRKAVREHDLVLDETVRRRRIQCRRCAQARPHPRRQLLVPCQAPAVGPIGTDDVRQAVTVYVVGEHLRAALVARAIVHVRGRRKGGRHPTGSRRPTHRRGSQVRGLQPHARTLQEIGPSVAVDVAHTDAIQLAGALRRSMWPPCLSHRRWLSQSPSHSCCRSWRRPPWPHLRWLRGGAFERLRPTDHGMAQLGTRHDEDFTVFAMPSPAPGSC